jgi:hypothetical protein
MDMRPDGPVDLEVIRRHDEDLELLAGAHRDLGDAVAVTWHRRDGSVLTLLTHATEEARAYLAQRHAHRRPG